MSNQRSEQPMRESNVFCSKHPGWRYPCKQCAKGEQPVSVCSDCGGTKEKPLCVHQSTRNGKRVHIHPESLMGATCVPCTNSFHSSAEPTTQTVAGGPKRCKTCACKLCEDCENDEQCCGCEDMKVIADLRRQLADLQKDYENNMVIKDCKQCHGHVEIIDSESGGFPAKCHCYQVRCNELRARAEKAERQLAEREAVIGKITAMLRRVPDALYHGCEDAPRLERDVKAYLATLASPSTILESVRQEKKA